MSPAAPPYPHPGRAWVFVLILFVASIASVIDRAVLNIVVDPIKADIGLGEVQIALLQGLAFGLFYAVVGLPLGLTADRYSRRWLIIVGMSLWSGATIAGGLTHSFTGLFASRLLVGLGEAALSPAAISLIGDLFPPGKRGRPISVFLMGQAVAVGLSISVAGLILQAAHAGAFRDVAILGGLAPWRVVFVLCGVAGLGVLAMMLTTREPDRRTIHQAGNLAAQAAGCLTYMLRNRSVFAPFYLGFAFYFAAVYGAGAWAPTMLMRSFGQTGAELARRLGPLSLALGILGPLVGGFVVDRLSRAANPTARLKLLSLAPLLSLPGALAAFAPGAGTAIVLVALMGGVTAFIGTVALATLQAMVPAHMRGLATALTGLINTLIGASLGPLIVAELTEHVYMRPSLVGYSIATLAVPALMASSAFFAVSLTAFRSQLRSDGDVPGDRPG